MLGPNLLDQQAAFENQFEGMSDLTFNYADYEATRDMLIDTIRKNLNESDKQFLLSFNRLQPDWSVYDYQHFPSVKWKLFNLAKFKEDNPETYQRQLHRLEELLAS
jgi:hypothetical protein